MLAVLRGWRQVGRRRAKLLKGLLGRKARKERAMLSVFLTQMRINCSSIGLERRLMRSKAELLGGNELQDLSCILKRSATSQKPLNPHARPRDTDRTLHARRNCPKRTK